MADQFKYRPNRVRAACSTNSTGWLLVGTNGTGYTDYAALVTAGATPYPGSPRDFPTGLNEMIARSIASGGTGNGGTFKIVTNSLNAPGVEDDLVSDSGQTFVFEDDCIKSVWIKKTTGTDTVLLAGLF